MRKLLVGLALLALGQTAALGALIQIQVSGIDLVYDRFSGTFCTTADADRDCERDEDITLTVLQDGNVIGQLSANQLSADLHGQIAAGTNPLSNSTHPVMSDAAFNRFIIYDDTGSAFLILSQFPDTTSLITFSHNNTEGTFGIEGSGLTQVFLPSLPFPLVVEGPISWSFTASGTGCFGGSAEEVFCLYSGSGEFSWRTSQTVSEPAVLTLLSLGLLGVGALRRRRS